jgi:hypothetical protein
VAKILQRLSALEQATCAVSGHGEFRQASGNDRATHEQPDSAKPGHFLLVDRTGPIAEFASWSAARDYMSAQQHLGATIISVEEPKELGPTSL